MNIREFLEQSLAAKLVLWVETDLPYAGVEIEKHLSDLLTKRSKYDARYRVGEHYIHGITPMSVDRCRGVSADAVYIGNYSVFAQIADNIRWTTAHKERVRYFTADGETESPFS